MSSEESQELLEIIKQDVDVQKEAMRALTLYKKADYVTKAAIGEQIVIEKKLLESAVDTAVETISRVSTERDHYKDMLGDAANQDVVQQVLANKLAKQTKNEKNRQALSEIRRTIEQSKAICKKQEQTAVKPPVQMAVAASQKK